MSSTDISNTNTNNNNNNNNPNQSIEEITQSIKKELVNIRQQKSLVENEIIKIAEKYDANKIKNDFNVFLNSINQSLNTLTNNSTTINNEVKTIAELSDKTLKSFEILKYRKSNVEKALNTLTAILEINKILPEYNKAVDENNLDECTKYIKVYKSIENCLNLTISPKEIQKFNEITNKLVEILKIKFENAIETNEIKIINQISQIFVLLNIEEKKLDKIIKIYQKKLGEELMQLTESFNKNKLKERKTITQLVEKEEEYGQIFHGFFVDYLRILNKNINLYKESILTNFKIDGFIKMIENLVNYKAEVHMRRYLIDNMTIFFELNSSLIKSLCDKFSKDEIIDINIWYSSANIQNSSINQILSNLDHFCEEVSSISHQNELFTNHLVDVFLQQVEYNQKEELTNSTIDTSNNTIKEEHHDNTIISNNDEAMFANKIRNLTINNIVHELLDKLMFYQKISLKFQIVNVIQTSPLIKSIMTFDKNFFGEYINLKEDIHNRTQLFEYLDEMFVLTKNAGIRCLECLSKTIVCAFMNFITNNIISEDIYKICSDLFMKMLKKEFFNSSMISLSNNNNVYNTVIIILFNNTERLITYIKNLKETLLDEFKRLYIDNNKENTMIFTHIEDIENHNINRFQHLLDEKFKILVEYLKQSIKSELDKIKDINFQFNEGLMSEIENKYQYANTIKNKMNSSIIQWRSQLSKSNFEKFISSLSESLAKTFESYIMTKKYHQLGAMLLDKEIRGIINYFQSLSNINVKRYFSRLSHICEMLLLDNQKDMEEFYQDNIGELTSEDVKKIVKLRSDLK